MNKQMELAQKCLEEENASLVVVKQEEAKAYFQDGIKDLVQLLKEDSTTLQGTTIADKVVGRAAAALMIKAGVKQLYTTVLSKLAKEILDESAIVYEYGTIVDHVINRTKTGMCPMEQKYQKETVEAIYHMIIE